MDQLNSTMATSNFSTFPGLLPQPNWYSRGLIPSVVFSFCFLAGVPGNVAVIILRPNWEHLSSLSQKLLLNLALSDLLCLLTLPPWIYSLLYGWTFNLVACKLLAYLVYCSVYGSQLTMTGLSIQRYLMVVHRHRCHQVRKNVLLVLLWLVAFILSIPSLVIRQVTIIEQQTHCQPQFSSDAQWLAVLITETGFGFIFLSIVAFSYVNLKRTVNQAAFFNHPQTTRLVTSIIVSSFILWVPLHSINVLGVAAICVKDENLLTFYKDTWNIVAAITFISSCLNPLFYAFTSHKICTLCQRQRDQGMPPNPETPTTAEP